MNINDVITADNRFLKAIDLKGRNIAVRIEAVTVEDFKSNEGSKKQFVLKFFGAQKVFGLNKTNTRMIASMYGDETDGWIGKEIVLRPDKTQDMRGALVDCIRINYQPPVQATPQPAAPQQYSDLNPPPHDSVPF